MSISQNDLYRLLSHRIADTTDTAFLLIGTDYRVQWISESAKNLLYQNDEEMTGRACAHALKGKVCSAQCLAVEGTSRDILDSSPFGPSCMEETADSFRIQNCLLQSSDGETLALLKQVIPAPTSLPSTVSPEISSDPFIARGSWAKTLAPTLSRIAGTTIPILLVGETGTGKEVLANRIHSMSPRKNNPFVVLDLSTVPETLVDDALFGHIRGAFTGATSDYTGKLIQADKGTVFLDELENVPLSVQAKLLRFLEPGIVERIGQSRKSLIDVRILAATNVDPEELIRTGRLREDLFYRLRGLTIEIPPLRKRQEDIPLLIQAFRGAWSSKYGQPAPVFSPQVIERLVCYPFPGNVRELKHLVDLCMSLAPGGGMITGDTLPDSVKKLLCPKNPTPAPFPLSSSVVPVGRVSEAFATVEKDLIVRVLNECHGRVSEAARKLAMSRITLWRKMKKYNLDRNKTFLA
jgi:transcriptional regulator with PAS, ATPase and Fis domain